jgi:Fur family iron response transcriptional regulator
MQPAGKSGRDIVALFHGVGLRPTRQRIALGKLLWRGGDRHVTAEQLFTEAQEDGVKLSLATVYNVLHQLTRAGLLRSLAVDAGRTYFDTNCIDHYHFYDEKTGLLEDIPADQITIHYPAPEGRAIASVGLIIKTK